MSLINGINVCEIKKIFANREEKLRYLELLSIGREIVYNKSGSNSHIDNVIIDTWDYDVSKEIIRSIFMQNEKYIRGKNSKHRIRELMSEWRELKLGEIEWPFSATNFDQFVHHLNRSDRTEAEKDAVISGEAVKFRRIKDINAYRNDYIEYLIFEGNKNVIPTLKNSRGVDFYINGEPYDQKVSRSVGKSFTEKYGEAYRQTAIERPDLLAKSLYQNQDQARFGKEPRLLIVYLDEDLTINDIEESLKSANLNKPLELEFEYIHAHNDIRIYSTQCYIVLLHKK